MKGLPMIWGNPDLAITKLLEFTNHFYLLVEEKSTGTGALELLVDRYSGLVKSSPTTAWNAQYGRNQMGQGMMGRGMMGGQSQPQPQPQAQPQRQMAVSPERATELAQQFLARQLPGTALGEAWSLPGYYTLTINRDGRLFTLLSVNGLTGQVWLQSWHGGLIAEQAVP
ncbi:MAG: hypothetical protein GWN58_61680 [Anaerolineae bacterium]|nr:hypothetical protein [Anaerolineae bacterium]